LKIVRVDPFLMSFTMPEPVKLAFWGGERTILKRDAMLIRITTDTGLKGFAPGPAHERAAGEIKTEIGPFLLGKNPLRWKTFDFRAHPETVKTYRSVEIALADLAARHEGCALSETIGGRKRDRIKLYGSAGMYMPPEQYAEEAAAVAGLGFPAYKMRPGIGPDRDLETVERMRQAVGPDVGLMVDAHTWWRMGDRTYSTDTIVNLANAMAAFGLTWLEEPFPPEKHDLYRQLRPKIHVKLASGEHEPDDDGFLDLIGSKAVDYVQMDILCQGGFPTARKVFSGVQTGGLRFAFHSWGTQLEVLAAAHVGICWPENVVEWLEFPCYAGGGRRILYPFPLAEEILAEPLDIRNGHLVVPDGPGLGVEINERVIEKYPYKPGPWSFFRLDSPPETVAVTGDHSVKWVKGETHA